ncbi:MAG: cation transporter, partial [Cytophagaceae bacterium]
MSSDNIHTLKVKTFPIRGMSCAGCAQSIESILRSLPGVKEANVNFASNTALVTYDSSVTEEQKLKDAVSGIGYELMSPQQDSDHEAHHHSDPRLTYKMITALLIAVPVIVISMFWHTMPYAGWILFALSVPVVFWSGSEFYKNAWKRAMHFSANMDTLIAMGTGVAFLYSACNLFFPDLLMT